MGDNIMKTESDIKGVYRGPQILTTPIQGKGNFMREVAFFSWVSAYFELDGEGARRYHRGVLEAVYEG